MNGYIKSYRKIEDNPLLTRDNDYFRVWYYLLHNASHKNREIIFNNEKINLKLGQLITGRNELANKCNISSSKAQRILKKLEIEQQIEQQTTNKNRLITIKKWDLYQQSEQETELPVNNKWTTTEQQVNTNKKDKKDKNVKNDKNSICSSMYVIVEQKYSRTLNSMEKEMIDSWVEKNYSEELVVESIRLSLIKNKRFLTYPNGILQNWEEKGYKTLEDVRNHEQPKKEKKEKVEVFDYNWLDEEEES